MSTCLLNFEESKLSLRYFSCWLDDNFEQLSTVVKLSEKNFDFKNFLSGDISIILPSLRALGQVLDTFSDGRVVSWAGGRSGGEWIIVLTQTKLDWSLDWSELGNIKVYISKVENPITREPGVSLSDARQ